MDTLSSLLLIASVCAALLSDTLDKRFAANGQLRKVLLVCSIGVACICLIPLLWSAFA